MWYAYPQHSTGRGNFSLVNNHYEMASRGALASPLSMTAGLSQHNPHTHSHLFCLSSVPPLFFPPSLPPENINQTPEASSRRPSLCLPISHSGEPGFGESQAPAQAHTGACFLP